MKFIKARELKIGNNIIGNTGVETVRMILGHEGYKDRADVHEIYKHLIGVEENRNQYNLAEIKPIPLTEERMEQLGFELLFPCGKNAGNRVATYPILGENSGWHIFPFNLNRSIHDSWRLCPLDYSETLINRSGLAFTIHDIKFVHQLQNLFYDITGKELVLTAPIKNAVADADVPKIIEKILEKDEWSEDMRGSNKGVDSDYNQ